MGPLSWFAGRIADVGTAVWILYRGGRGFAEDLFEGDELSQERLARAFRIFVWRPLAVLVALAALAGLIAGLAAAQVLERYHAEMTIEPAVARALARDVVPLLVGVFASGRVSVEIAGRLGGMRLGRELEALEALGQDPVRYVLSPSIAAIVFAVPIHVIAAYASAWAAAGVALQAAAVTPWSHYVALTLGEPTARAILVGVAKALVFSAIAAGVGATVGSREDHGPAAIGTQSTVAFTSGLLGVFIAAAVWASLQ